ncbi:hypothetical protein [Aquipuribacter nitratireducens]|uniref:Type IV pilus biogenesis protein PilO n=1 Tax=Aquipuribacter nitratireducens TaxID=650104 RepID=A0ABW0GT21_9MICO
MKLTRTAGWSLGTAGLCVALSAASWFLLVDPQRAAAAESRELTVAAQQQNADLELQIEQLKEQFANLPQMQAELAAIREALPEEPALSRLIRDVDDRGVDAGIIVDSIVSGVPVAVVDTAALAAAPADPAAAESASAEPSAAPSEPASEPSAAPSEGTDPASDPAAPAPAALPAGPVLAAVPVTITATGDFSDAVLFLKGLQADTPRALLVDSLGVTVAEGEDLDPGSVQVTVTGRVFVFSDPTAVDAATATGLPSPTPTVIEETP